MSRDTIPHPSLSLDEQVLVIPRAWWLKITKGGFEGFRPFAPHSPAEVHLTGLVSSRDTCLMPRRLVESDPSRKQIVAYVVAVNDKNRPLAYTRRRAGSEARLHRKRSIGVGGHVSGEDLLASPGWINAIGHAASRELSEEIRPEIVADLTAIGLVNDESNQVGTVHVGVVYAARIFGSMKLEDSILDADWLDWTTIGLAEMSEYEAWSAMILKTLAERAAKQTVLPPGVEERWGVNGRAFRV